MARTLHDENSGAAMPSVGSRMNRGAGVRPTLGGRRSRANPAPRPADFKPVYPRAQSALGVLAALARRLRELCTDSLDLRDALAYLGLISTMNLSDGAIAERLWQVALEAGEAGELMAGLLDATGRHLADKAAASLRKQLEDRFFRRLAARVYRFVAAGAGPRADVDDIADEAFAALWNKRAGREAADLWRMAYIVARNRRASHMRRFFAARRVEAAVEHQAKDDEAGATAAETAVETGKMLRALGQLSPKVRAVMALRLSGFTFEEIADANGQSLEAVKKLGQRGVVQLRQLLEKEQR